MWFGTGGTGCGFLVFYLLTYKPLIKNDGLYIYGGYFDEQLLVRFMCRTGLWDGKNAYSGPLSNVLVSALLSNYNRYS